MIRLSDGEYFRIQYNKMVEGFYTTKATVAECTIDFEPDEVKVIPCRYFVSGYAWFYKYKNPLPIHDGQEVRGIKFEWQK